MKDKITHLYVDSHERTLILHSPVELKNALIRQGRYTDCIDELIFKVANAPVKKMKIEYVYCTGRKPQDFRACKVGTKTPDGTRRCVRQKYVGL